VKAARILLLALALSLLAAIPAQGKVVELTKYDGVYPGGSFDGSGSVGAPAPFSFGLQNLGISDDTGQLFVGSESGRVYKFSGSGVAETFSTLAPETTLPVPINNFGDVFVDNTPTANNGRIYAFPENGPIRGFEPDGSAASGFPTGVGSACGGDVAPDGSLWIAIWNQAKVVQVNSSTGALTGAFFSTPSPCDLAIDSQGNFYTVQESAAVVRKYDSTGSLIGIFDSDASSGEPELAIDLSNDHVYVDHRSYINEFEPSGALVSKFGLAEDSYPGLQNSRGVAVNSNNHTVYAINQNGQARIDRFVPTGPITIPDVTAEPATDVGATSGTLHGVVNPDGIATTDCSFKYGIDDNYNLTAPCEVGGVPTTVISGTSDIAVSAPVTGLAKGSTYHYRLTAKNSNEVLSQSNDIAFTASDAPSAGNEFASAINTDSAQINADVDPAGGATTFHFEWGTQAGVYDHTTPVPDGALTTNAESQLVSVIARNLAPGTTYHYRIFAHNDAGSFTGGDNEFTTFASPPSTDACGNAHVRQQTGAAYLAHCRAYELVSAEDTGGYNVESDLVPGQTPFGGYPRAGEKVLYGVHNGAIPGPWNPTNRGVDPYVATRGEDGWKTEYVGIPADLPSGTGGPFASPLAGADESLNTFAFAGDGICDPCFGDGSVNVPLRMPDGELIKGMAGSLDPSARPSGRIVKRFSADGSHFLFGSTAKFEDDANSNGTDTTIYDRDLDANTTQVVSTLPDGNTIANGTGVAALDISDDGSRIVIGRLISTDAEGSDYYHLYMHVGSGPATIDLTPGTTSGALYDGMTSDGSSVYLTTPDALTTGADQDTDTSADIYRADVGSASASLTRVSAKPGAGSGGVGDTDACDPPGTTKNEHWNTVDSTADCSAAAIAGGGGVATESDDIYFLSPEELDTSNPDKLPVEDAPNLYVERPGQAPHFVATLESEDNRSDPEPKLHTESGSFGNFTNATGLGLTPNGDVLVYDIGNGKIERYSPTGSYLGIFAEISVYETEEFKGEVPSSLGVDRTTGDVFASDAYYMYRYDQSGSQIGYLGNGGAVGVNQQNHNVYIGGNYPQVPTIAVVTPDGSGTGGSFSAVFYVRGIATDSRERTYVASASQTALYGPKGQFIRTVALGKAYGVAVDPANDDVYVDQGNLVLHFNSSGNVAGTVNVGAVTSGRSIEVGDNHRLYLIEGGKGGAVHYYDESRAPDLRADNPAVIHAVDDAGTRHTEDLQVTPDGRFAAFSSTLRLAAFNNLRRSEIYRYEADGDEIECASCPPTNGAPTTDTTLAPAGLNLADDGRVFFTSAEPLVLRDSNAHRDAYEWDEGKVELISLGASPYDSTLLSASADGTDAYFFTRDNLVPQDRNRTLVKIYDARADGGFAYVAPPVPCRASDECHGPSSEPPGALTIPTISGSSGNNATPTAKCPRGKVRKKGKCVRRTGKGHRRAQRARRAQGGSR
jgi:hypothetical protein